ncbi:MAG: D-alanyl-D-alanine carboxypeptidase [Candidatus Doudnabacteria bacterium]|nr:D-alanyl-D-alanine carboxypeptidase [Candidatus Doudnabacteria bacterium]
MNEMKQKEKGLFLLCSSIVFLAAIFLLVKFIHNAEFGNVKEVELPGQVLGATVDARGEMPFVEEVVKELPVLNEKFLVDVEAKSYMVFNLDTGQVLAEKNSETKLPIASLTKLMTGYVSYINLDFTKNYTIYPKRFWQVSPFLNIKTGDSIKAGDLFESMLIGSANDAAFALSEAFETVTGLDFVREMNTQASLLGMKNTSFSNPAGFDSQNNFSTAKDLKVLVGKVFNIPVFNNLARKTVYSFKSETGNLYRVKATNKLIGKYSDIFAIKTGFTKSSLGSMATVLEANGKQIVIIVLDSQTREADTLNIRKAILEALGASGQ